MLSKQSNKIIKDLNLYKKGKKYFKVYEDLSYDGYDSDGPESNIWTLFIYDINNRLIEQYGREYWFRGEDKEEYSLNKTWTLEDFKKNSYYNKFFDNFIHLC
jgi:hypothetical protein